MERTPFWWDYGFDIVGVIIILSSSQIQLKADNYDSLKLHMVYAMNAQKKLNHVMWNADVL